MTPAAVDLRLLFLVTTAKDAATTADVLAPLRIPLVVCDTFDALLREIAVGAGAVLLPEEAISPPHDLVLRSVLAAQPAWSDLPVLVLTRTGANSAVSSEAARVLGNVTLLERPVRVATLLTSVRSALRARERQYQIREHLQQRASAEESLRLADRRKDEFLATLGHELRNPLAPLLTAVQLLKMTAGEEPLAARVWPVMERQINHLVRLVNDLLEISRITRGLVEVHREPIDLATVVHSAIDTSRPALETAGHTLRVTLPREPVTVQGDSVRLTQVFANLLNNAAKYTAQGGHIDVRLTVNQSQARVSIRDNGIGIPTDQLASVFEMFTQVDRSSRLAQGGLGIGLTLVRSLVALHEGTVEARSDGPGTGSEFTVSLPLLLHSMPVPNPRQAHTPMALPDRRVLVVDDNCDAAETLAELLRTFGADVAVAHNGRSALDLLESFAPDAIVLDIGMPEMDGYEVARRIRSRTADRHPRLIALTGWGQRSDYGHSRAAGFDHHLVKPPDIARLCEYLAS